MEMVKRLAWRPLPSTIYHLPSEAALCSGFRSCARLRASRLGGCRGGALRHGGLGIAGRPGEGRKCGRRGHGEIGQLLAVDRVAGSLETGHQLTVGEPVLTRGGVDPDDPQAAEVALLAAAADKRILERGVDRLFRGAIELALVLVEPFGPREKLLTLGAADISSFDSRHTSSYLIARGVLPRCGNLSRVRSRTA